MRHPDKTRMGIKCSVGLPEEHDTGIDNIENSGERRTPVSGQEERLQLYFNL